MPRSPGHSLVAAHFGSGAWTAAVGFSSAHGRRLPCPGGKPVA
jgi:hypothetical protein